MSSSLVGERHFAQAIRYLRRAQAIPGFQLPIYLQEYVACHLYISLTNQIPDILRTMGDMLREIWLGSFIALFDTSGKSKADYLVLFVPYIYIF